MNEEAQDEAIADACLTASRNIWAHLQDLAKKISQSNDPLISPTHDLKVDKFLAQMAVRKNAPRITLKPVRLGKELWTESITAYIYAGIEGAFVKAGKLPGGNSSGHVSELRKLRSWVDEQRLDPSRIIPDYFVQKIAFLFSKGILEERRRDRIEVISRIGHSTPSKKADLIQLKVWLDEDLADSRLRKKGRPVDYQKIVFAVEIANLWNDITGKPITKKPDGNFGQFVVACWKSGFESKSVNSSFKRTIREHIGEENVADRCGRCEKCKSSERCSRKRYFGILM